jgi:hypothetical protein
MDMVIPKGVLKCELEQDRTKEIIAEECFIYYKLFNYLQKINKVI